MKKYENSFQGQRSIVTRFQSLLAFTMGHIPTKLHQFLIGSFRNFVRTDTQTQNTQMLPKTIPACSMHAGNKFRHSNYNDNMQTMLLSSIITTAETAICYCSHA